MTKALLDTDILSEISKAVDQTVLQNAEAYLDERPQLTFTSISVYEVLYGLGVKTATRQMREFLELVQEHEEVTPTASDYRLAADIRAALHRAGTPIGSADPVIAACALARRLPLVTGNTRHYGYVQSAGFPLLLLNWREAPSGQNGGS